MSIRPFRDIKRRKTKVINVGNIKIGGENPISCQTMTNTLTTDVKATIKQINEVVNEGADAGDYINPEVTDLGNSEFMVQWTYNQNYPQTLATGSYAQLYNYEGTKKGMAFTVSDTNSGSAAINTALKIDNSKFCDY